MCEEIKRIINSTVPLDDKKKMLNIIKNDLDIAEKVLLGKFKYCPKCDDYYLSKSFLIEVKTENYIDGFDGFTDITYEICPKSHIHEIGRVKYHKL